MSQERYPKEHHFPSHHELFLFVKTHFLLEISSSQTPINVHSVPHFCWLPAKSMLLQLMGSPTCEWRISRLLCLANL